MTGRSLRRTRLGVGLIALCCSGCLDLSLGDGGAVTVATSWPASERSQVERVYPGRIRWVALAPGDDLARVARHAHPPDVLLGGPIAAYRALERAGALEPDPAGDGEGEGSTPPWRVARRVPMGLAAREGTEPGASPTTLDDPRRDDRTLAWARGILTSGAWDAGHARLVRAAGGARRPGRAPGAAVAAVLRNEATAAATSQPWSSLDAGVRFIPVEDWPAWVEGVAVLRNTRRPERARTFFDALSRHGLAEPPRSVDRDEPFADPAALALLADLLGATLVDAEDELETAWKALELAGDPDRAVRWMTAPPPWPPASVSRILANPPERRMPLLETLAAQVAPDAEVRGWLVRSWLAPSRAVDAALLTELAGAVEGRLAREPRFRAWLRGEWRAWARQRYRRVTRTAEGAFP